MWIQWAEMLHLQGSQEGSAEKGISHQENGIPRRVVNKGEVQRISRRPERRTTVFGGSMNKGTRNGTRGQGTCGP